MRPIKFRFWSKEFGKILEVFKLNIEMGMVFIRIDADDWKWCHLKDGVLMQFTGLIDKNGKEIYEGDILKHDLWGNCQIIWEHGMFRGQSKDENYDFTLADYQRDRQRIIGNIYENPELPK